MECLLQAGGKSIFFFPSCIIPYKHCCDFFISYTFEMFFFSFQALNNYWVFYIIHN